MSEPWETFILFFIFTGLFAFVSWGFMILSTQAHENVHVAIFDNYNISSRVEVNKLTGNGVTYPNNTTYPLYCGEDCKYANSLNEIVGYNTDKIAFAFLASAYLIGIIIMLVTRGGKEEKCVVSSDSIGETQNQKKY